MIESEIGFMFFFEAIVSVHMSLFVLIPLAEIINKGKKNKIFCILFLIRAICLIIGNITIGMAMVIFDFIFVFFGAGVLNPIIATIKRAHTGGQMTYNEYNELSETELINNGIEDSNLLKQKLLKFYKEMEKAKNNKDKDSLRKLCDTKQYDNIISNIDLYNELNQTKKTIINDIIEAKIVGVYESKTYTTIDIIIKEDIFNYVEDNTGKIISGSKTDKEIINYYIRFIRRINPERTPNDRCRGCGAPLNKNDITCPYCNLKTGNIIKTNDWKIRDINIIK